jgi:hypothetical protein
MMTSALALSQVLTTVILDQKGTDRFLSVVAEKLALSGDDREHEAALFLSRAIKRVKSDIDGLPFEESQKNLLWAQIACFTPIVDFSHLHLNLENMRGNSLTHANIVGLTNIHMALAGFTAAPELDKESLKIAEGFRALREGILASDMPESIKKIVIQRINQIVTMIENFAFFGTDELEREISALTGTILIRSNEVPTNSRSYFKKAVDLASQLLNAVGKANKGLDDAHGVVENGQALYSLLSSFTE